MTKKLIIGTQEWGIADTDAEGTVRLIRDAMINGTSVELALYDPAGDAVTVFLNGAVTSSVALDLNSGPRPSQMS
jgi:hypothetical protein